MIISSLLGKQNVATVKQGGFHKCINTGAWAQNYIDEDKSKITTLNTSNWYVCVIKATDVSSDEYSYGNIAYVVGQYEWATITNVTLYRSGEYITIKFKSSTENVRFGYVGETGATIKEEIVIDLTSLGLDTLTAQQFYNKFNPIFDLLASGGSYDTDSMPFMLSESVSVNSKDTDIIADITRGKILWEKPIMMSSLLGKQDNLTNTLPSYTSGSGIRIGNSSYQFSGNPSDKLTGFTITTGHKYYIYVEFVSYESRALTNTYQLAFINLTQNNTPLQSLFSSGNIHQESNSLSCIATATQDMLQSDGGVVNCYGGTWDEIPTKTFIIDLTALGLDTLTAQQFYDNFNQYFSQLANGNEVMVKYSKYGIVDLGTLNYAYESQNTRFKVDNYEVLSNMETVSSNEAIPDIKCVGYRAVSITDFDTNNPDKTIRLHRTLNGFMYFRNTYYTDPAKFKLSLTGIYLLYKKA